MEQAKTITVDDVAYEIGQFSPAIQQAVGIYNAFQADLQKAQLEVIKCQSAMQSVGQQLSEAVKTELEATKAAASEEQLAKAKLADDGAVDAEVK